MIRPDASTYGVVPIEFLREVERVIGEHRSVLSLVLTRIGERANDGGSLNDDELWGLYQPTGDEIQTLRLTFGQIGEGTKRAIAPETADSQNLRESAYSSELRRYLELDCIHAIHR